MVDSHLVPDLPFSMEIHLLDYAGFLECIFAGKIYYSWTFAEKQKRDLGNCFLTFSLSEEHT